MSYMVEILLLEQDRIEAMGDLDSDQFNDLLLVQSKLKELTDSNKISPEYLKVLDTVLSSKNFKEVGEKLGMSRNIVIKIFSSLCDMIGKELGYWFTDEGLIQIMEEKYNLSEQELLYLKKFLEKRFQYYKRL